MIAERTHGLVLLLALGVLLTTAGLVLLLL